MNFDQRPHFSHLMHANHMDGSILQSAMFSKSDSIPVLLANCVNVASLDSTCRSELQLACDADAVQLLLISGAWLHSLGTACMLNATTAGNATVLTKLLGRSAGCDCAIA
jgi:hypothetical protein